ncbi:MAG: ACT domain-containing protein [Pseudomonadota bacterium]
MPAGEMHLGKLLAGMQPSLEPGAYVFATLPDAPKEVVGAAVMMFREDEGVTFILPRDEAERLGVPAIFPCRMITLRIHSALEAVGFLSAIAAQLTEHGIGLNPVSAYHHDHLFIAEDQAEHAMAVLRQLADASR